MRFTVYSSDARRAIISVLEDFSVEDPDAIAEQILDRLEEEDMSPTSRDDE